MRLFQYFDKVLSRFANVPEPQLRAQATRAESAKISATEEIHKGPYHINSIESIVLVAVAHPKDPAQEHALSSLEFLTQAFSQFNREFAALTRSLVLDERITVHSGLYARGLGSPVVPDQVSIQAATDLLGPRCKTWSLLYQTGVASTFLPDGSSVKAGFVFLVAFTPPKGIQPWSVIQPLSVPITRFSATTTGA